MITNKLGQSKIRGLSQNHAYQFAIDCLDSALLKLGRHRWQIDKDHIQALVVKKQAIEGSFKWSLVTTIPWWACFYVASSAGTIAAWEFYGIGNDDAKKAHLKMSAKGWEVSKIAYDEAWSREEDWQLKRLREKMTK